MTSAGDGYLARVEANSVSTRAAPGVVFLRLQRGFAGEQQTTGMFAELTPGRALELARDLEALARRAIAGSAFGQSTRVSW